MTGSAEIQTANYRAGGGGKKKKLGLHFAVQTHFNLGLSSEFAVALCFSLTECVCMCAAMDSEEIWRAKRMDGVQRQVGGGGVGVLDDSRLGVVQLSPLCR